MICDHAVSHEVGKFSLRPDKFILRTYRGICRAKNHVDWRGCAWYVTCFGHIYMQYVYVSAFSFIGEKKREKERGGRREKLERGREERGKRDTRRGRLAGQVERKRIMQNM
eukprot:760930-Amorphochlora_amoeboformis.AAC.2